MARKKINVEPEIEVVIEKKEPTFSKEQILESKRFRKDRYIVSAVLETGKEYTCKQVEDAVTKFKKRGVQ